MITWHFRQITGGDWIDHLKETTKLSVLPHHWELRITAGWYADAFLGAVQGHIFTFTCSLHTRPFLAQPSPTHRVWEELATVCAMLQTHDNLMIVCNRSSHLAKTAGPIQFQCQRKIQCCSSFATIIDCQFLFVLTAFKSPFKALIQSCLSFKALAASLFCALVPAFSFCGQVFWYVFNTLCPSAECILSLSLVIRWCLGWAKPHGSTA